MAADLGETRIRVLVPELLRSFIPVLMVPPGELSTEGAPRHDKLPGGSNETNTVDTEYVNTPCCLLAKSVHRKLDKLGLPH